MIWKYSVVAECRRLHRIGIDLLRFSTGLGAIHVIACKIGIGVWRPEALFLWMAEQPDHFEDISETLELKIAALREHHSQLDENDGWEQRVRQRAAEFGQQCGVAAAEAFRKLVV